MPNLTPDDQSVEAEKQGHDSSRPLDQETFERLVDEGRKLSKIFDKKTKGMRIFTPEERMKRWR